MGRAPLDASTCTGCQRVEYLVPFQAMSKGQRFVGDHNGIAAGFFVALVTAIALIAWVATPTGSGWAAVGIATAVAAPVLLWLVLQLQDIITADPESRTLQVLRRRALIPDKMYTYAGADVLGVELRKINGEDGDTYIAYLRASDHRKFAVTRNLPDRTAVEDAARKFLAALGRDDLCPRYSAPRWP